MINTIVSLVISGVFYLGAVVSIFVIACSFIQTNPENRSGMRNDGFRLLLITVGFGTGFFLAVILPDTVAVSIARIGLFLFSVIRIFQFSDKPHKWMFEFK